MNSNTLRSYVLAPSAFGFLWEECNCCYYRQVVEGMRRPSAPFPSIFSKIDVAMKHRFATGEWHAFGPSQPQFKILHAERMIQSLPITIPGRDVAIALRGKFDSVLEFQDGRIVVCDCGWRPKRAQFRRRALGAGLSSRVQWRRWPVGSPGRGLLDADGAERPRDDQRKPDMALV